MKGIIYVAEIILLADEQQRNPFPPARHIRGKVKAAAPQQDYQPGRFRVKGEHAVPGMLQRLGAGMGQQPEMFQGNH